MMINHNTAATSASRHVFNTNIKVDRILERLSSGLRINSAADDASGLAIARKMEAQNRGLEVANQNAQDGLALYRIAEGALSQVNDMLARMEELTTRAINGTLTASDRKTIQDEINQLRDQINTISKTTEYNTIKLLDGTLKPDVTTELVFGQQDSMRLTRISSETMSGSFAFVLSAAATPAVMQGDAVASLAAGGTLTVNGIDITFKAGDSVSTVASRINAVNAQTGVLAVFSDQNSLTLVTGKLDDDARNIAGATEAAIGYAVVGSAEAIRISGNGDLINSLGLVAGSAFGTNAAGRLDGVALSSYGNHLKMDDRGNRSYGIELDVDLYNGGSAVYVQMGTQATDAIVYRSQAGDEAVFNIRTENRMRLQIGANYDQSIYDGIADVNATKLGVGASSKFRDLSEMDVTTSDNANYSLKVIQQAIVDIAAHRSEIGAIMNRLDYSIKTVQIQRENMMAAQARIEDADMAAEMTRFTKEQIMLQAGTAMLAQANARPQQVLQLLQQR